MSQTRSKFDVGISVTVVPDGFDANGTCRLSLQVIPKPDPGDEMTVDIRDWPRAIAGLSRNVRVAAGKISFASNPPVVTNPKYLDGTITADLSEESGPEVNELVEEANRLWKTIFSAGEDSEDAGFLRLINIIRNGGDEGPTSGRQDVSLKVAEYLSADLCSVIHAISSSALASTLAQRLAHSIKLRQASEKEKQSLELPRDSTRPPVDWWKRLNRRWFSPPPEPRVAESAIDIRKLLAKPSLREARELFGTAKRVNGLQEAAEYFRRRATDHKFWSTGEASADSAGSGNAAFLDELANFNAVWRTTRKLAGPPLEEDECKENFKRAPTRKFAGMLSYPSLSKFFQLIVDVTVDRERLSKLLEPTAGIGRAYGAVAVDFVNINPNPSRDYVWPADPQPDKLHWTAVVLGRSVAGSADYFGPCGSRESEYKHPAATDDFQDGVVNLNVKVQSTQKQRFEICSEDVANGVMRMNDASAAIVEADRQGHLEEDQSTRLPPPNTRGLTMFDRESKEQHFAAWEWNANPRTISFAEHLFQGYRIDVATLTRGKPEWKDRGRWRSLVGREVSYPDEILAKFLRRIGGFRRRDEGRVRTAVRSTSASDTEWLGMNDEVFTWTGESLATPSLHHNRRVDKNDPNDGSVCVDAKFDMGINIHFDLLRGTLNNTRQCLPPLREGRSYIVGARACFVNGCGPELDEAVERYIALNPPVVLGTGPGEPICFEPPMEVQAPDVLLPWDSILVNSRDPRRDSPGENIETLVVRSGARETRSSRRLLMPARVSFDASEQAGVFDSEDVPQPAAAFTQSVKYRACRDNGTYPIARFGTWDFPGCMGQGAADPPEYPQTPDKPKVEPSRGSVLALDTAALLPFEPFYPDPHGSHVCAGFSRGGKPAVWFAQPSAPTAFWKKAPYEAVPIVLDLRSPRRGETNPCRGWFANEPSAGVEQIRGGTISLPRISVVLKPAEDVELELWPHSAISDAGMVPATLASAIRLIAADLESMSEKSVAAVGIDRGQMTEYLSSLTELTRLEDAGLKRLASILCLAPTPLHCTKRTVRLVHAVDQPLTAPAVELKPLSRAAQSAPVLQLNAVVITVSPDQAGSDSGLPQELKSWADFAMNHVADPIDWTSEPGGTTTFFVGSVTLHRPSTISMRAEAQWGEYEPAGTRFDTKQGKWCFNPRPVPWTRLFNVESISIDEDFRDKPLDLLKTDIATAPQPTDRFRGLSYAFPDGKARQLSINLIATSRFTEFFPPLTEAEQQASKASISKYERAADQLVNICVPATIRPRHPDVDRVMPVFEWKTTNEFLGKSIKWERDAHLRVYMDRDTWHSTGEGEMLAVAFGPFENAMGEKLNLCTFETEVQEFGQFITRWGADPIHVSGGLEDLVPMGALHNGLSRSRLRLPFAFPAVVFEVLTPYSTGEILPAGTIVRVSGDNFIRGAEATVNGRPALATVISSMELSVQLLEAATSPLQIDVRNPDLLVSVKAFTPELDPEEGLWYCNLKLDPAESYYPFVQLGLTRYQPCTAPHLELSEPRAVWAQLPARREGGVTINDDRKIIIEHHGVGYGTSSSRSGGAGVQDVPLLNLRLLRASHAGRVPHGSNGPLAWTPVLDGNQRPIQKLQVAPHHDGHKVWWCEEFQLPPCVPGLRYGLQLEEVELLDADPEPTVYPERWRYANGVVGVTTLKYERTMFLHVVDLGE